MAGKCQCIIVHPPHPHPFPFTLLPPPLAEAVSCGLINSALMGAQQDGGEVERGVGGRRFVACGSIMALFQRDKVESALFPLTKSSLFNTTTRPD